MAQTGEVQQDPFSSLLDLKDRFGTLPLLLIVLGIGAVFVALALFSRPNKPAVVIREGSASVSGLIKKDIHFDIEGAVVRPGVYTLPSGSRVKDAFVAAGGLSQHADREYVAKTINQAMILSDGGKLYIPVLGENASKPGQAGGAFTPSRLRLVNINTASLEELDSLPGVGKTTGEKIINGRLYQRIEELVEKKIVNQTTFEKIKEKITVY